LKKSIDLLSEECVELIIDFLELATAEKTDDSWVGLSE
jgi:DNA helicase-2/ATP-dependent DNA helicase PcrA